MQPLKQLIVNAAAALMALLQAPLRLLLRSRSPEWIVYEVDGQIGRGDETSERLSPLLLPAHPRISTLAKLQHELRFLASLPPPPEGPVGILLHIGTPRCGLPVLLELRELLLRLRASGRRVVAYADALDARTYWLASAANEVWLTPRGRLELTGFAAASSAAAGFLAKLGVKVEIIRAGTFKSAGELLGNETVSPEQRLQLDELVGDLEAQFTSNVAAGRRIAEDDLRRRIDGGPFTARAAVEAGLVDGLCYADELREKLAADPSGNKRRARIGPFGALYARFAPPLQWRPLRDGRPELAVVDVEGNIIHGRSHAVPMVASTAGSEDLVATLTRLRRDPHTKAVVLRIDSRGGSALASDLIWRAAQRLAEKKPVVAYLDGVAASGGYYIAAAAKTIIASPGCITGSIGVIAMRPDMTGTYDLADVDRVVVKRGARAGIYRPDVPLSDDERQALQRDILETYGDFVRVVADGRGMDEERVRELGEGRVYLATRAQMLGLVDRLGSLDHAIEEANALACVPMRLRVVRHASRQAGIREMWREWRRSGARSATRTLSSALSGPLVAGAMTDPIQTLWTGENPADASST